MLDVVPLTAIAETDHAQVGGKAFSLGRLLAAGLPVPAGFVVTVAAFERLHQIGTRSDPGFRATLQDAYRQLGSGPVAVRSSSLAEDGAVTSHAGQQETRLGVIGEDAVLDAIEACWKSLHSERAVAYRRQSGLPETGLAMAVVVQTLIPAEVAGVLFTRDPQDATNQRMSVEAAWGLGEVVVSGRVTPDRFHVDLATGTVQSRVPGDKSIRITANGAEPVPEAQRRVLCLSDSQLSQLAELARRVEQFANAPQDIEWAWHADRLYLLQARPITTATAQQREATRQQVIEQMRSLAAPGGTVWVRYNLSEVLPAPLPMTWSVVQRLIGADGGFGAMNRDLGAVPDPTLGSLSGFDLVAGRPMCNLSRLPRMQFPHPPIEYPFAKFKQNPKLALDPNPVLNPMRDGMRAWLRLPGIAWRLYMMSDTTRRMATKFADEFTNKIAPQFVQEARTALQEDWSQHDAATLLKQLHHWIDRTLLQFARHSLKPTVFADLAFTTLVGLLKPRLGLERAQAAVRELATGAKPAADADLAGAVKQLHDGKLDHRTFLERFGHRCQNEMELAQPRWSETPEIVRSWRSTALAESTEPLPFNFDDVAARIAALGQKQPDATLSAHEIALETLLNEAKLTGALRAQATRWTTHLRRYVALRESAKNDLMRGYAVIRKALVELGRITGLRDDLFDLRLEELPALIAGHDFTSVIRDRKQQRQRELSLELPDVLFSDALESIGQPQPIPEGTTTFEGIAISAGTIEGTALVLTEPTAHVPHETPYILVCPSTDPAWVPLFVHASGLILETGGVLSHGAIVAREFGLPAVAGLPGITQQLRTGQRLHVDGTRGIVTL